MLPEPAVHKVGPNTVKWTVRSQFCESGVVIGVAEVIATVTAPGKPPFLHNHEHCLEGTTLVCDLYDIRRPSVRPGPRCQRRQA
jgi:hypothetical protein